MPTVKKRFQIVILHPKILKIKNKIGPFLDFIKNNNHPIYFILNENYNENDHLADKITEN